MKFVTRECRVFIELFKVERVMIIVTSSQEGDNGSNVLLELPQIGSFVIFIQISISGMVFSQSRIEEQGSAINGENVFQSSSFHSHSIEIVIDFSEPFELGVFNLETLFPAYFFIGKSLNTIAWIDLYTNVPFNRGLS